MKSDPRRQVGAREVPFGLRNTVLVIGAAVISAALSYGFSRVSGALGERIAFPVGTPALVLGLALTWWAPGRFGWQWGHTRREVAAVAGSVAAVVVVVAGYRLLVASVPYQATLAEVVVVPLGEEALFRGFLLTTLLYYFSPRFGARSAARWAIAVSSFAFGCGHLGNLGYVPAGFVLVQAVAASLFGVLAGWLRVRTDSLAGPVLAHAAMNAAAVM